MKKIKIPPAQVKAVKEFMLGLNLCNQHTPDNKVIQDALNLLLYGEANLRDAQDDALKKLGLEPEQSFDQARLISRWALQSKVLDSGGSITPPDYESAPVLEAELRKTEQERRRKDTPPPLYLDKPEEVPKPKLKGPPWESGPFWTLAEIKTHYPRHPLLKIAGKSKLHKLAVQHAFGVMPLVLHKSAEIAGLAEELHKTFKDWDENNT
jgi:hypothetical protein